MEAGDQMAQVTIYLDPDTAAKARAAAKEAGEAAIALPDDWFARELAVKLTLLAGGDPLPALKELLAHQDARSHGPLSEL